MCELLFSAPIQHHHAVCNNPEYSKYITLEATGSPNKNKCLPYMTFESMVKVSDNELSTKYCRIVLLLV